MRKFEKLLAPLARPSTPSRGDAGYDNPRENIDPQVKTQVVYAREIVLGGVRKAAWPTSSGHIIEYCGDPVTQRDVINFLGAGVSVVDSDGETTVTIPSDDAVDSVFGRTDAVIAASNDYTWAQVDKTTSDIANITTKSHTSLSDIGTNTHAHVDTHIGAANPHSGSAASGANSDIISITGLTTDLAIIHGGTSQSTAQAAINSLSAVAGATNEHVLTKDTATGNAIFKVAAGGGGDPGEGHITILPWNYNSTPSGTWELNNSSSIPYYINFRNNPTHANGNAVWYKVYLAAGTYTFQIMGYKSTNTAITDIYFNDTEVASFDWYAGAGAWKSIQTQTAINVATSGLYDLKIIIDGHNASSSDYYFSIQSIALWRTA